MNMVNWDIIDRARRNQKWSAFSRLMKIMHGWLPLMHNLGKRTGIAQCPGCECPDETYNHMFNCGNALMKKALSESFETMRKVAWSTGVPDQAMDAFMSCITNGIHNRPATPPQYPKELEKAVEDQNKIGTCKLLQGFMAKSWLEVLEDFLQLIEQVGDFVNYDLRLMFLVSWELSCLLR